MFYERYISLCEKNRISPSAAATQAGFNRGTVSVWKRKYNEGADVRPEPDVISKICAFFNCPESWLLGIDEQKEKTASQVGSGNDYDDFELFEAIKQADEQTKEVIRLLLKRK